MENIRQSTCRNCNERIVTTFDSATWYDSDGWAMCGTSANAGSHVPLVWEGKQAPFSGLRF